MGFPLPGSAMIGAIGSGSSLGSGPVTTLTFIASATGTGSTVTVPAAAQAGDWCINIDYADGSPDFAYAVGWNGIAGGGISGKALVASYKILTSGDLGAAISGQAGSVSKSRALLVFRPNNAINGIDFSPITWGTNLEGTDGNPSAQTIAASGVQTPLIVFALIGTSGVPAFSTASPAFTATVGTSHVLAGYKIYNTAPASHTVDMNDLGTGNIIMSFWYRFS